MLAPSRVSGSLERWDRTVRTLPIRLDPLPEESLDSWLEALARRSATSWGDLLTTVGLTYESGGETRRAECWLELTSRQSAALSHATGVAPRLVRSMTLTSLMAVPDGAQFPHSTRLPGSRFCPACLAERDGRWLLWWRLRWAFACPKHACLLVDECPTCHRSQRLRPHPRDLVPDPALCTRSSPEGGRKPDRCRSWLANTPAEYLGTDHPAVTLQERVLTILAAGSVSDGIYADSPVSGEVFLRDLTALGQRVLRYADAIELRTRVPRDLWQRFEQAASQRPRRAGTLPPWALVGSSPAVAPAAAACLALPILLSDTRELAGERLRWLVASMRRRGLTVSASNVGWGRNVSEALISIQLSSLAPFLGPVEHLRYRRCTARPRPKCAKPGVHRSLPAALWPQWAFRFATGGIGFEQLRSALSVAIVLVGSRMPVPSACALLGDSTKSQALSRVLQKLYARPDWDACAAMLIGLTETLSATAGPIDYERRRALDYTVLLREEQWHTICHDIATPTGRSIKARLHRCWLFERITGSLARSCPHAISDPRFFAALADLPRTLSPELAAALDDAGRDFLVQHGVVDEPLMWVPMLDEPVGPGSAFTTWADIHVEEIHRFVSAEGLSLSAVARQTGTTLDVVREILNCRPAPRLLSEATLRAVGEPTARARHALSRDQFLHLYLERWLSLAVIAAQFDVSRQTITRLAHEYGITLRPAHRPRDD